MSLKNNKAKNADGKVVSFDNSAVIVYPVSSILLEGETNHPTAHSTIMWLGDVTDAPYTKDQLVEVLKKATTREYIWARVAGTTLFGEDNNIPVLQLQSTLLEVNHTLISKALEPLGAVSASAFGYSPHVTVEQRVYDAAPHMVTLGPVELWWREEVIQIHPSLDTTGPVV